MTKPLSRYRSKRHFKHTPEPRGTPAKRKTRSALQFVIQKHEATRLHYDLRLEVDGTLKSWAVPKEPSLDPRQRRLAIQVEDHPMEYGSFEGIIPEGNYGAGRVHIWDKGTYDVPGVLDPAQAEKQMRAGLEKGSLHFELHGEKLKGRFALVRTNRGEKNWLLFKKKDTAAAPVKYAVHPMLATLVDHPFDKKGWLFEIKWDGYRAIAEVEPEGVALYSRNGLSLAERFAPLIPALKKIRHQAVLDGEVVVLDSEGRSSFQQLQRYLLDRSGELFYYAFDLLYLDGEDLRDLPLIERKARLQKILPANLRVRYSDHIETKGTELFDFARAHRLEGIIAKAADSPYRPGIRSSEWLKIKTTLTQQALIAGYTEPRASRKHLGALILGVADPSTGRLRYIGHTGTGFDERTLKELQARLSQIEQDTCPFPEEPKTNAPAHWVKPLLIAEIRFQGWTDDGRMRAPVFLGLREDLTPQETSREKKKAVEPVLMARSREEVSVTIDSTPLKLTHLDKVFWPKEGYTKSQVIQYYQNIAPWILPHLIDRPQSLHRHPNGIEGESFFQKNVSASTPKWIRTVTVASKHAGSIRYLLCQNRATLIYLANLGCIELNPWLSRIPHLDRPDYLVLDLDPEGVSFGTVIETAIEVRRLLEKMEIESYVKTSGKTGLHIAIPLYAPTSYNQSKELAESLAQLTFQRLPKTTSLLRSPAKRPHRVYLDFLQNRRGQTLTAPYSLRPWPGATVSTPLQWKEVNPRLDPSRFDIRSIFRRLESVGDLWEGVLPAAKGGDRLRGA